MGLYILIGLLFLINISFIIVENKDNESSSDVL